MSNTSTFLVSILRADTTQERYQALSQTRPHRVYVALDLFAEKGEAVAVIKMAIATAQETDNQADIITMLLCLAWLGAAATPTLRQLWDRVRTDIHVNLHSCDGSRQKISFAATCMSQAMTIATSGDYLRVHWTGTYASAMAHFVTGEYPAVVQ